MWFSQGSVQGEADKARLMVNSLYTVTIYFKSLSVLNFAIQESNI